MNPEVLTGPAQRGDHVRVVQPGGLLPDEAQQRLRSPTGGAPWPRGYSPSRWSQDPPDRAHAALADDVDQLVAAGEQLTHQAGGVLERGAPLASMRSASAASRRAAVRRRRPAAAVTATCRNAASTSVVPRSRTSPGPKR